MIKKNPKDVFLHKIRFLIKVCEKTSPLACRENVKNHIQAGMQFVNSFYHLQFENGDQHMNSGVCLTGLYFTFSSCV